MIMDDIGSLFVEAAAIAVDASIRVGSSKGPLGATEQNVVPPEVVDKLFALRPMSVNMRRMYDNSTYGGDNRREKRSDGDGGALQCCAWRLGPERVKLHCLPPACSTALLALALCT